MKISKILFVFGVIVAPAVSEGQTVTEAERQLELDVVTDRLAYRLDDGIVIDVRVKNVSRKVVRIFSRLDMGYVSPLDFVVLDEHGTEVMGTLVAQDGGPFAGEEEDPSNLMKLWPGHYLGTSFGYAVKEIVPKAGRYTLKLRFRSVLDHDSGDPSVLTRLEGLLVASLPLEVVPD